MEAPMPLRSSRPVPLMVEENEFQQRKRTPFRGSRPPNIAAKSCPPVSRIAHRRITSSSGPQLVSFKSERKHKEEALLSPHYNLRSGKSYFEQCFQLCDKLGEGSFGEVFKVQSREDGMMYAVKKSRQHFKGTQDRRQKLAEVERHEHLSHHPNCVKFHKAWEERDKLYIQTELCQMSLAEYADLHGRIPEQRIWHILVDLVKGLKHLHDNRLCHFDIKPANIFLGDDSVTCKLGDFGLCASLDYGFKDAMEGDAKYLAPELLNHEFGKPADIFSLGISLLELACELEPPSSGKNWHLLREGRIPPHLLTGLSSGLVDILCRMMHPDPKLRPTVDELLSDHCVVLACSQQSCFKACAKLLSAFVEKDRGVMVEAEGAMDEGGGDGRRERITLQNESFSEEEEDDLLHYSYAHSSEDISDPSAKFNRSWINHSPMKYPSPIYGGPPIPINFEESSPDRQQDTSPCRTCRTQSSPHSVTPAKKIIPKFKLQGTERKKLLEAFSDTMIND